MRACTVGATCVIGLSIVTPKVGWMLVVGCPN